MPFISSDLLVSTIKVLIYYDRAMFTDTNSLYFKRSFFNPFRVSWRRVFRVTSSVLARLTLE